MKLCSLVISKTKLKCSVSLFLIILWEIYISPGYLFAAAKYMDWSWKYTKSLTDTWRQELELRLRNSFFLGIYKLDFRYSVCEQLPTKIICLSPPMSTATAMAPARSSRARTQHRIFFHRPLLPSAFVTYSFSPLKHNRTCQYPLFVPET